MSFLFSRFQYHDLKVFSHLLPHIFGFDSFFRLYIKRFPFTGLVTPSFWWSDLSHLSRSPLLRAPDDHLRSEFLTNSATDMLPKIALRHYHWYSKNKPSFHHGSNRAYVHSHLFPCTRFVEEMECMFWATQNKYIPTNSLMIHPNLAKLSSCASPLVLWSIKPMYLSDWTSEIHQPENLPAGKSLQYI